MKYLLTIKLANCVPSKVVIKSNLEDQADAMEWAQSVYDANQMILSTTLTDAEGTMIQFIEDGQASNTEEEAREDLAEKMEDQA